MREQNFVYVHWQKISTERSSHICIFSYINRNAWSDYRQACRCSLSSGLNVYWSRKNWACKFWFVCVCCQGQGSCRVESITIGMWTWLLERLWKSHRPMIKNSVQASLQPHHSGCLHKGTVHCNPYPPPPLHTHNLTSQASSWHNRLNSAPSRQRFLCLDRRNTFKLLSK